MRIPLLLLVSLSAPLSTANAQAIRMLPGTQAPLRPASECIGVVAPESPTPRFRPAQPTVMVSPPLDFPRFAKDRVFSVRSRVDTAGAVDSVEVSGGKVDRDYMAKWMKSIRATKFRPAEYDGCRVVDWYVITVDFTPPGRKKPDAGTNAGTRP